MDKYSIPRGSLISFMSNKVKEYGGINLAQGIPGFSPPEELLDILSKLSPKKIHQYAPGVGNSKLLDLLVSYYQEYFPFQKNDFLIVQGATEAISLLYIYLRKTIAGPFSVLAFDPVYETYKNLPEIFNDTFLSFPFDEGNNINFYNLEKTIQENNVKIFFISSPGNPYGKALSKDDNEELIRLSEKLNFFIVFDAVYKDVYFTDKPYTPLEKFNKNFFYINSFSKMLSITGWRIGYLIAHEGHADKIKSIHDYTGLCAPSILQEAIAEYLKTYSFGRDYLENLRAKLASSFNLLAGELKKFHFHVPEINGGYFIWTKLPDQFPDGFKFAIDLYEEEKVAVIPGIHFSNNCKNFVRLNFAREEEEISMAIEKLRAFLS